MAQPILAQYTVRSKQEYIFRTNRMQEIVGASAIISQSFDLLFSCAEELGVKTERGGGAFRSRGPGRPVLCGAGPSPRLHARGL